MASPCRRGLGPRLAVDLPQHADEHTPKDPDLLAVDQELSEGAGYAKTRYRRHRSGTPFNSCSPASSKTRPEPAVRSFTV